MYKNISSVYEKRGIVLKAERNPEKTNHKKARKNKKTEKTKKN